MHGVDAGASASRLSPSGSPRRPGQRRLIGGAGLEDRQVAARLADQLHSHRPALAVEADRHVERRTTAGVAKAETCIQR